MTIRMRLALQFGIILAVTLMLFSAVVYYFSYRTGRAAFTNSLFARALVVGHVYADGANRTDEASRVSYRRYLRQFYRTLPEEEVRVYDENFRLVFREGASPRGVVPPARLRSVQQSGQEVWLEPNYYQMVGRRYHDRQRQRTFIIIASSVDTDHAEQLQSLRVILAGGLLVALVLVGIGGWFFAGQALRPMQRMVQEVDGITGSDLHRRLTQDKEGQDEVSHLAQRFNRLLDRLETAFVGQRTFVRDASHELRTPLTSLIGELEVALLQERPAAEYRRVLQSTLDAARLLKDLTNGLLQIARASNDPSQIARTTVRLDELLLQAHEEMQRRHPTSRIDLEFPESAGPATAPYLVWGNEALLLSAMLNVLENACKFSGEAGHPVVASLSTQAGRVSLQVHDQGVGMSEADRQQVFVPFFRAESVRTVPGHGIGLPLTAKIMDLHGGAIQVQSELGKGTRVRLELPLA
ncbi:HAMP domain-containing histidine kinase [Hymenobacter lutimineralis]|uniref:histidine kinase n=1 Tax=Hymenobacter lutimineralis TaxID=2606448 RepID=A0A5D6V6X7_9BACT|nr:HAMP domain-containing sensor histidine kinase [Hymenobacter lutimineralis]TYZ10935.1 HAMP domain-containing histidine kinase [Hymenobacter lutimineralis]